MSCLAAALLLLPAASRADTVYGGEPGAAAEKSPERDPDFYTRPVKNLNADASKEALGLVVEYEVSLENDEAARENVRAYLQTMPEMRRINLSSSATIEKIKARVRDAVKVFGFYNPGVAMEFKSATSAVLVVYVEPGKKMWVRRTDIQVLGEAATDPGYMRIFKGLKIKSHTPLSHEEYEGLKSKMMAAAITRGYFDGHFIFSKVYANLKENYADVRLIFNSGRRYRFGEVRYSGDVRYRPAIAEIVDIREGVRFDAYRLSGLGSRLYETGYFSDAEVSPLIEETENYQVPININLKRKKFNVMEVGLGYATDEGVRGKVTWNMPLLNERGDSLLMQIEASQVRQEFLTRYKIPFHNPLSDYFYLQAQQSHEDLNDTLDDITSFQGHFVTRKHRPWSFDGGVTVQYEDYTQGLEKGNAWTIGPTLRVNYARSFPRRDQARGENYTFRVLTSSRALGADVNFVQLYAQAKWLFNPTRNSRLLFKVEQGVNVGPDAKAAPPSYRFFVGGDNSVRGFAYKSISNRDASGDLAGGRYLTAGTAEIQLPVIENMRWAWFVDAGQATNDYKSDETIVGAGTGVRYVSPVGLIKFDFGFGVSETHIPFRVHFGIGPDI